jgi:hypothetical protein
MRQAVQTHLPDRRARFLEIVLAARLVIQSVQLSKHGQIPAVVQAELMQRGLLTMNTAPSSSARARTIREMLEKIVVASLLVSPLDHMTEVQRIGAGMRGATRVMSRGMNNPKTKDIHWTTVGMRMIVTTVA